MSTHVKNKAISITKLIETKFDVMELDGEWLDGIGDKPEMSGVWFIWGASANGKSYGAMKLAKYLTRFSPVIYNDLEEGKRKTTQRAVKILGIKDVARRFVLLNGETIEELKQRLNKRKSPRIVFINSFQYVGFTKKQYIAFKEEFPNHLIIFISHAEGKHPEGKVAKFARYDADVKIFCEGYKFFISSRYGGGKPVIISYERAQKYWGEGGHDE